MEEYFKKISNATSRVSLTERERTDMRLQLAAFIDEHPAQAPLGIRTASRISDLFASSHVHFGFRSLASALVIVLVAGVGTSYAAENALPGNPLYTVKINVDEPIERATVASSESPTQWDITLANRRLQEAEKLAASDALTPQNAAIVETQLNTDTQDFNANVAALATSTANSNANSTANSTESAAAVADAQSNLEAALSAHVQVLADIASSSPSVGNEVAPLLAGVRAHASLAYRARIAALADLNDDATSSVQIAASSEMQAAVSQLSSVRALARAIPQGAPDSASSSAQIGTDASDTAAAITAGDKNLARGRFKQAFAAFENAVSGATEAQVGAQAQANLAPSVVIPPIIPSDDASSTPPIDTAATSTTDSAAATSSAIDDTTNAIDAAIEN